MFKKLLNIFIAALLIATHFKEFFWVSSWMATYVWPVILPVFIIVLMGLDKKPWRFILASWLTGVVTYVFWAARMLYSATELGTPELYGEALWFGAIGISIYVFAQALIDLLNYKG